MQTIGLASSALGATLFLVLTLLLLAGRPGVLPSRLLLLATLFSTLWLALASWYQANFGGLTLFDLQLLELLRDDAWLIFLMGLLGGSFGWRRILLPALCLAGISLLLALLLTGAVPALIRPGLRFGGFLGLSLLGLLLVESLYRNSRPEERWSIKLLCLVMV